MADEPRNNGFVSSLVNQRRGRRLKASRRGFLRGSVTALAATTVASALHLFGPARKVDAQTGLVGSYPRRVLQFCPPYNSNDNCQPGCGSSPICTDCCGNDGWFRNDPANGYTLYAGGCGDGDIADAWLWRYKGVCGSCAEIEYRCSDGYVQTDTGPVPFICRVVTDCVPLAEGQAPGTPLADAARSTNWKPAGRLELAVDNGSSVSISGWVADGTGSPVDVRLTANGTVLSVSKASQPRPDIAASVRGAGPNTGFSINFPLSAGQYKFCVDAVSGVLSSRIGCVDLAVGSGGSARGPAGQSTIAGAPAATAVPRPTPTPGPSPTPGPTATPGPTPTTGPTPTPGATATAEAGSIVLPTEGPASASQSYGAVQVLRRSGPTEGFVSGWAGDADSAEAVLIDVTIDGQSVALSQTELPRPDVARAFPRLGGQTGFAVTFPLPEGTVTVCIDAVSPDDGRRQPLGCRDLGGAEPAADAQVATRPVAQGEPATPRGVVYGAVEGTETSGGQTRIWGWAFDPNDHATPVNVVARSLSAAGAEPTSGPTPASAPSPAVRAMYGVERDCGFELFFASLPTGAYSFEVIASSTGGAEVVLGSPTVQIP